MGGVERKECVTETLKADLARGVHDHWVVENNREEGTKVHAGLLACLERESEVALAKGG